MIRCPLMRFAKTHHIYGLDTSDYAGMRAYKDYRMC